jgi:hypothetical protein
MRFLGKPALAVSWLGLSRKYYITTVTFWPLKMVVVFGTLLPGHKRIEEVVWDGAELRITFT